MVAGSIYHCLYGEFRLTKPGTAQIVAADKHQPRKSVSFSGLRKKKEKSGIYRIKKIALECKILDRIIQDARLTSAYFRGKFSKSASRKLKKYFFFDFFEVRHNFSLDKTKIP